MRAPLPERDTKLIDGLCVQIPSADIESRFSSLERRLVHKTFHFDFKYEHKNTTTWPIKSAALWERV